MPEAWHESAMLPAEAADRRKIRSEELVLGGSRDRGGARGYVELGQDIGDVTVRRMRADAERRADLPVTQAARHEAQHLDLPLGQRFRWLARRVALHSAVEVAKQRRGPVRVTCRT
jgi:hypothetical protein